MPCFLNLLDFTTNHFSYMYCMKDEIVEATGTGAAALSKSWIKSGIYTSVDATIIVEDEFLNLLAVKMKTLREDDIVLQAVNHFGAEWVESSKKVTKSAQAPLNAL